jgi:hypothetical protein
VERGVNAGAASNNPGDSSRVAIHAIRLMVSPIEFECQAVNLRIRKSRV